jgi:dTDP-4-dehydrorhamnose reductase
MRRVFSQTSMAHQPSHRPLVLFTGSAGQLGSCFREAHLSFPEFEFLFADRQGLDVTLRHHVLELIESAKPAAVINCAAYTNVERAESEEDMAFLLNAKAPQFLAEACAEANALLVHFSTDYVFDGKSDVPYRETDETGPLNAYGRTKLEGERLIDNACDRYLILRISWLYSRYGHNFYRTMRRLAHEKTELNVVEDQLASPTSGHQLASDMLKWLNQMLIQTRHTEYGIYHYTQSGITSWKEFAQEIITLCGEQTKVSGVSTAEYPTRAERPQFSKLETHKFYDATGLPEISWQKALADCILNDIRQ